MTGFKRAFPFLLYLIPFAAMAFVQSTAIILPTNDNTSAFVVEDANNNPVFSVAGDGNAAVSGDAAIGGTLNAQNIVTTDGITAGGALSGQTLAVTDDTVIGGSVSAASFHGDGSALENVRPIVAYTQGNFYYQLDPWDPSSSNPPNEVRTVSITVPSRGIISVSATGTIDWESKNWDVYRAAIIRNDGSWGYNEYCDYFDYLSIGTDYACADSSDQYAPFASSRNFSVSSGGTYTYSLYMDCYISSSWVAIHDVCLTATYYPNASAVAPKAAFEAEPVYKADRWIPNSSIANP